GDDHLPYGPTEKLARLAVAFGGDHRPRRKADLEARRPHGVGEPVVVTNRAPPIFGHSGGLEHLPPQSHRATPGKVGSSRAERSGDRRVPYAAQHRPQAVVIWK